MTDWADEIAGKLPYALGLAVTIPMAQALRKAKADGMREAAVYVAMDDGAKGHYLDSWADRIEYLSEPPSEQNSAVRIESNETK